MADDATPFQQYYRGYDLAARDVALIELQEALTQAGTQSRLYSQLANLLVALGTVAVPLLARGTAERVPLSMSDRLAATGLVILLLGLVLLFFAELQKTITLNARKAITLRGSLGLDYTHLHLTLPNWRLEGATNPFAVRLFPGWLSATAFPLWAVCVVIGAFCYFLLKDVVVGATSFIVPWWSVAVGSGLVLALFFRHRLQELHETPRLRLAYLLAQVAGLGLIRDFGGVLFRAKLAVFEMRRLGFETAVIKDILVALEDQRFFEHRGVDFRSAVRALLSRVRPLRRRHAWARSGASTISMQLVRTLLVQEYSKARRRKLLELILAGWLEREFSKAELLDLYLASVRFAPGLVDLPAAVRGFFRSPEKRDLTPAEAFLLVERLSNVRGLVRPAKLELQLRAVSERSAHAPEREEVLRLYEALVRRGVLQQPQVTGASA